MSPRIPAEPDVRSEGISLVLRGAFNPPLISPGWLLHNGLISEDDYGDTIIDVVVPQLSGFRTTTLKFQVTPDLFSILTEVQTEFEMARDMMTSILKLLPHTPVNMLGINHYFHVAMPSFESWHAIGDRLAPKDIWERVLTLPGMQDVTIESVRDDDYGGAVHVTVQPSTVHRPGVFLHQNDHFLLKRIEHRATSREDFETEEFRENYRLPEPSSTLLPVARTILFDEWTTSHGRAQQLLHFVWNIAREQI
jgi:hypothetical protein